LHLLIREIEEANDKFSLFLLRVQSCLIETTQMQILLDLEDK